MFCRDADIGQPIRSWREAPMRERSSEDDKKLDIGGLGESRGATT
jgi:hypothetical protein